MIYLLSAILVVLVAILVVFIIFLIRSPKSNPTENKSLTEMVDMMREAREEELQEKRDKEMLEYGLKHSKLPEMVISSNREDGPVIGPDAIPYNLNDTEKEILRQFYGRS